MKFWLLLILLQFTAEIGLSQTEGSISKRDKMKKTAVCITAYYPLESGPANGSGFIVENSRGECFLVTAAHVADSLGSDPYVIFQDTSGLAVPIQLNLITPPHVGFGRGPIASLALFLDTPQNPSIFDLVSDINTLLYGEWKRHPIADLAVMKLDFSRVRFHQPVIIETVRFFQISQKSDPNLTWSEATVLGFPHLKGVSEKHFSIMGTGQMIQTSKIVQTQSYSSRIIDYQKLKRGDDSTKVYDFILLNWGSEPGYSGGPVFNFSTPGYEKENDYLIGIVHGNTPAGKSKITPAYYLWDLIKPE